MRRRAHPPSGGGSSSPKSSTSRRKTTSRMGGRGGHAAPGGLSCGPAAVLGTVALVLGFCLFLMASMLDDGVTTTSGEGGGGDGTKGGARGLFKLRGGPRFHLSDIGGAFSSAAKGEDRVEEKEEEFYCERFRPPEAKEPVGPTPVEEGRRGGGNDRVLLYTFRHGAGQGLGQGIGGAAFAYGMALMCNRTFKMDFMVGKYKLEDVLAGEVGTNRTRWWSLVTPEERDWLHSKQKVTVSDFSGVKLKSDAAAYDQCQRDDLDVLVMLSYDYFPAALLAPEHFPAPYRQERWESHLDVEQDLSGCAWSLFADPPGAGDGDLTPMVAHLRAGDMAYHGGKGGETRKIVRTTGSVQKAAEAALKCLDETVPPDRGDDKPCEIVFVSDSREARDYAANTFKGRCKVRLTDATDARPDWSHGMTLEQTRTTWDDFYLMWAAERVVITGSAFSCGAVKNYLRREGATVYRLEDEIEHGTLCTGEGHRRDFVGDRVPPLFVNMAGQCRMNDEFSYLGAG